LLPAERNKTLRPLLPKPSRLEERSVRRPRVCSGFYLSRGGIPSTIDRRRVEMLLKAHLKTIAPDDEKGVGAIDEHGDRKWGKYTAHVGRQWLANIGQDRQRGSQRKQSLGR
jgi:hypothetical protein